MSQLWNEMILMLASWLGAGNWAWLMIAVMFATFLIFARLDAAPSTDRSLGRKVPRKTEREQDLEG